MMPGWSRFKARTPCAVCQDHRGKCCHMGPVENPTIVLCLFQDQGSFKASSKGMGWLHKLRESEGPRAPPMRAPAPKAHPYVTRLAVQCYKDTPSEKIHWLSNNLRVVSPEALWRLRVGWCNTFIDVRCGEECTANAYTFPMRFPNESVCGIRLRKPEGFKYAVPGSINAVFVPVQLSGKGVLWVVEGPTETGTLITHGIEAIGRPSNTAGEDYIIGYLRRNKYHCVVIGVNSDPEGSRARRFTMQASVSLAMRALSMGIEVLSSIPPVKDYRAWTIVGATRRDLELSIQPFNVNIRETKCPVR